MFQPFLAQMYLQRRGVGVAGSVHPAVFPALRSPPVTSPRVLTRGPGGPGNVVRSGCFQRLHTDAERVVWLDYRERLVKEINGIKVDAAHLTGSGAACCLAGWNFFFPH